MKVTKIAINPKRVINLGKYNTVTLDASVEVAFDNPVDIDSKEVLEAFKKARKLVKNEFKEQFKPYMKKGGDTDGK